MAPVTAKVKRDTTLLNRPRVLLAMGYVGVVVLCFAVPWAPRLFWTILLPLLPIGLVIIGFYPWRRICPLALWGSLGVRFRPRTRKVRRVPAWMERWFFVVTAGFLTSMLVVRLIHINGDGPWLGLSLIGIGLLAAVVNYIYPGKTWCNFICPVGTIERIYTDANPDRPNTSSQCAKCTACKKNCPDIDHENAYWKDMTLPARRIVFYSFPGIVLGFYSYYFLRYGDWAAYFDGRWTHQPASVALAFGPGFYFAPFIPAIVAASLTLLGLGVASFGIFFVVERLLRHFREEARARHLALTLAGFTAFNLFYVFAGQPTLQYSPEAQHAVAFIVPLVSAIFLIRRLNRSSQDYMKEKSARRLLANWSSKEPPPQNPAEVFAFFQGREQSHQLQLETYEDAVSEILADEMITPRSLQLLERLRHDLGINESEHRRIFAALSEEERGLLDPKHAARVEERLQLQGYQAALSEALLVKSSPEALDGLRAEYGVAPEVHESLLEELRSRSSPLKRHAQRQLEWIEQLRQQINSLIADGQPIPGADFAVYVLLKAQERAVSRVLETLAQVGDASKFQAVVRESLSPDKAIRRNSLATLRTVIDGDLLDRLEPIVLSPLPDPNQPGDLRATMESLLNSPDPYKRAAAALLIKYLPEDHFRDALARCLGDASPLVREIAQTRFAPDGPRPNAIDKMQVLRRVYLFANLDPEDLHELTTLTDEQVITPPDPLCEQGEPTDDFYVLITGQAAVTVQTKGQQTEQSIAIVKSGDVVGELSALDGSPRSATVRPVDGPIRVVRVRGEDFRRLIARRPDLGAIVLETVTARLRQTLSQVTPVI